MWYLQGGKSSRIVNCVLELKAHAERKLRGGNGLSKYSRVAKPPTSGKTLLRKNSEPFMKSMWTMTSGDRDGYMSDPGHDLSERVRSFIVYNFLLFVKMVRVVWLSFLNWYPQGSVSSLNSLVRQYLSDKKPEEIPTVRPINFLIDNTSALHHYVCSKFSSMNLSRTFRFSLVLFLYLLH